MPVTLFDIQRKYGESVYPLYKDQMYEPYMENNNRIGVKGAVLYNELEDKIQCSRCGKWFEHLQAHVRIRHKETLGHYKAHFGINQQTPICSKRVSKMRSKIAEEKLSRYKFNKGHNIIPSRSSEKRRLELSKMAKQSAQTKNKHGLCDAQIAARLVVVRDMVGRERIEDITSKDLSHSDINLYQAIRNRFGTFKKACNKLGIEYIGQDKYSDSEMIAKLRNFVITKKRLPKTKSDLNAKNYMPTYDAYKSHFDSWQRAKMMAGLDQLLEEVKESGQTN